MKKIAAVILSAAFLLTTFPVTARAYSSDTQVINTHGSKTYMGTEECWSERWDSSNFTDVTDEDVDSNEDLVIKGGKIGDVTVGDGQSLTIKGGIMDDVVCDGDITMTGGTADSLDSDSNIQMSGGKVSGNVKAEQDTVTLSGSAAVGGDVSGKEVDVHAAGGSSVSVSGTTEFSESMLLQGSSCNLRKIDGQSSGTLTFRNFSGSISAVSSVINMSVESQSTVTAKNNMELDTLSIEENSTFVTNSALTVNNIQGPGALITAPGSLTVNTGMSGYPVLNFNGSERAGLTVFKAKANAVTETQATVFGYNLSLDRTEGTYDYFTLQSVWGEAVTLDRTSASLGNGKEVSLKATVPSSASASGYKLCWKLLDPSGKFSIAQDSSNNTCRVYLTDTAGSTIYKATLAAYLMDSYGNVASGVKSAVCSITSTGSFNAGLSLDTSTVKIAVGNTYKVLAITDASAPPTQMSYNSAIAVVGKATYYNANGKKGWLYPVKAVAKGGVTIDIGGQKMMTTVV
ncbi:polymer-forming cytoskeletal protein [Caproiciproducens galactitolivorans]|uniref:Polymer-forming cytoskeletal protein n=1 Tax=Caproiciproducens galactitolivorans TaxID=642589 RepID=A0ABT4BSR7_9FIRM|nr:polymer-forming cytoskeletal protein [Caproiciproducens galactitolivorans]MCY1713365.1 polymer-forming cytoskeletal protein [Caproiciproducens galactitolivorans]